MNLKTVYFLQALYDAGADKEKLIETGKTALTEEIDRTLHGILDPDTLCISKSAGDVKDTVAMLRRELNTVDQPLKLNRLNNVLRDLEGETAALLFRTSGALDSDVIRPEELHFIVPQFYHYCAGKMRILISYHMYRILVLTGKPCIKTDRLPADDDLSGWIKMYFDTLLPGNRNLNTEQLDGRWAYERKSFEMREGICFEQFVPVAVGSQEFYIVPGTTDISAGAESVRISGRGRLTDLTPEDLLTGTEYSTELPLIDDFSIFHEINTDPDRILKKIYKGRKYLISVSDYFHFINKVILVKEYYYRMTSGRCILCGACLGDGGCPRCDAIGRLY